MISSFPTIWMIVSCGSQSRLSTIVPMPSTISVLTCFPFFRTNHTQLYAETGDGSVEHAVRRYRVVKPASPEDLVFQSVKTGAAMQDNNILVRFIKPAGKELEIPWVNWRCLRTSHATWLKMAGADVKDAQAQLRHSRARTTLDIYQQFVVESQYRAVERLGTLGRTELVQ